MAVYGKIEEFDANREKWIHYSERLTQYFLANDVENEEKKRAILLSVIGPTTYSLLRSIISPNKPSDLSYDEICKALENHCNPKPSPIVQRFKFYHCERASGQSIASFAANLREISEACQFGTALEEMLRDRLVMGINEDVIQKRLLSVDYDKLSFNKAFEIATSIELATSGAKNIQQKTTAPVVAEVNKVDVRENFKTKKPCYRCGEKHSPDHCPFRSKSCFFCSKGHISLVSVKSCQPSGVG